MESYTGMSGQVGVLVADLLDSGVLLGAIASLVVVGAVLGFIHRLVK